MAHSPLISVVIPTCHRNDDLARCLERLGPGRQEGMGLEAAGVVITRDESAFGELAAISNQPVAHAPRGDRSKEKNGTLRDHEPQDGNREHSQGVTYEVIVSDDGRDGTAEVMIRKQFPWVNWVEGPGRGPAANRNHGARRARGRWIAFTDDDCLPDQFWLRGFASAIEREPGEVRKVLEGRTLSDGPKKHPLADAPINENGGLLWSCNFCIRHDVFASVGGFDERFPYAAMEDMDLRLRLENRGIHSEFVRDALVVHPWKRQDLPRHWRRHLKSQMIFLRLHPEQAPLFSLSFHVRSVARYYRREFAGEVRRFGWQALRCQPLRWYGFLLHAWVLWRRPEPEKMAV